MSKATTATATAKLTSTKDYRLFVRNTDNRLLDLKKHRNLFASMQQYGFLRSFPLSVVKLPTGKMMVKDGQHRLEIAEQLDIPVWWVEETVNYDVAVVNSTPKSWELSDYVKVAAGNGDGHCQELLAFCEKHKIGCGLAASLLMGLAGSSIAAGKIMAGEFEVKDRKYAEMVVATYRPVTAMTKDVKNPRFLLACMACCRVPGFDPERFVQCAKVCRDKLVNYGTRDAYLSMMEEVYNFKRQKRLPLAFEAKNAMEQRNVVNKGKSKAKDKAK